MEQIVKVTWIDAQRLELGVKPIIYKLNKPLGEGYSEFASYVIAICLYLILPKLFASSRGSE